MNKTQTILTFSIQRPGRSCWNLFGEDGHSEGVCLCSFGDVFSNIWWSRGFVQTEPFTKRALGTAIKMVCGT